MSCLSRRMSLEAAKREVGRAAGRQRAMPQPTAFAVPDPPRQRAFWLSWFLRQADGPVISLLSHMKVCNNLHMATNLALDDKLIEEARRAGHHKTKRDAVTAALAEYVRRRKQQRILEAFGTFEFDPAYDYKAERRRRRP
jgi:Arc/MetJ family transcription regulator